MYIIYKKNKKTIKQSDSQSKIAFQYKILTWPKQSRKERFTFIG